MVKVYDMVTYGMCEPGQDAVVPGFTAARTDSMAVISVPELQLIESTPSTAPSQELHPALRHTDVSSFLEKFGG